MKRTGIVSMVTIVATLLLASPVLAGNGNGYGRGAGVGKNGGSSGNRAGRGGGGFYGDPVERILRQLTLTSEQKSAMRALQDEHRAHSAPIQKKIDELQEKMRAAWQSSPSKESDVLDIHREIHQLRGDLAELRIQFRIDVLAILTPEQRDELGSFRSGRGGGFGPGMGRRGGGQGCGCGLAGGGAPAMDNDRF